MVEIPIYNPATDYKLTAEALKAAVDERTALIYIVDPNNPLGICYTQAEIEAFAAIAKECGAPLVHDCTYRDFATGHYPALKASLDNVVVTMSFSKWLGLAGLRIGAFVAAPALAAEIASWSTGDARRERRCPACGDGGSRRKGRMDGRGAPHQHRQSGAHRRAAIEPFGFTVPVYPSHGNFLVIETLDVGVRPEALVAAAKTEGIMIRQGAYHTQLFGDRFVKVSTTVPVDWVERFCERLPALVEAAKGLNDVDAQF